LKDYPGSCREGLGIITELSWQVQGGTEDNTEISWKLQGGAKDNTELSWKLQRGTEDNQRSILDAAGRE